MGTEADFDVAVVGAGLAGATAAAELAARGSSVVVLEARDRLGGRGYCRPFNGDGEPVDFGGSWITPWQHNIRDLCARHQIALRPRHPVTEHKWVGHADAVERERHDAALARLAADAARSDEGHGSLAAYLDDIDAPPITRDLVGAWWTVTGNGDKARVPASELLSSMAHGDGTLEGICLSWADTLEGGVTRLVERMLAASEVELRKECPVIRVVRDDAGVELHMATGTAIRTRAAVLATGINPLRAIGVEPPLAPEKQAALAIGNPGRAVKIWAEVRGVPVGLVATGGGSGIEWAFAERETTGGTTLVVGFGVAVPAFDVEHEARSAIGRLFPDAKLIAVDWHDWITDPYSQGTWVASVVGAEDGLSPSTWQPEGRLAFASSDVAPDDAGWFEGAVVSGQLAARSMGDMICDDRAVPS